MIHVRNNRTNQSGWVPRGRIEIGPVKVGDIRTQLFQPRTAPPLKHLPVSSVANDQFTKGLSGLLSAMHQQQGGALSFLPPWWVQIIGNTGNGIGEAVRIIAEGVNAAGLRDIFNNPHFSWTDIRDAAPEITSQAAPAQGGVYARLYWDLPDEPGVVYIYIGYSTEFRLRFASHTYSTYNSDNPEYGRFHYQIARAARSMKMVALCVLDGQDQDFHAFTEQSFFLLLESYSVRVLNFNPTSGQIPSDATNEVVNNLSFREAATLLTQTANQAKLRTGWPGGCSRQSFGNVRGLNVSSPVVEFMRYEKILWVRTQADVSGAGSVVNFRRTAPFKVGPTQRSDQKDIFKMNASAHFQSGVLKKFCVRVTDPNPPNIGDRVQVVFELMRNGERHPRCWARLPTIGPFRDWQLANSLALKVEWQDTNGSTRVRYLQTGGIRRVQDEQAQGSLSAYALAIGLIRYFNRQIPQNCRSWDIIFGFARMRELTFDYFNQTLRFSAELGPSTDPLPSSARRSRQAMIDEMTAVGLTGAGGTWQGFPPGARVAERSKCDACFLAPGGVTGRCEQQQGTEDCVSCYKYWGRPCSWTANRLLKEDPNNTARRNALTFLDPHPDSAQGEVFDPQLRDYPPPQESDG